MLAQTVLILQDDYDELNEQFANLMIEYRR